MRLNDLIHLGAWGLTLGAFAPWIGAQEAAPDPSQRAEAAGTLGWADCDGDGDRDALAVRAGRLYLLLNEDDGSLFDSTREAGLAQVDDALFAVWGDYDRDGDADLFVGTERGPSRLLSQVAGVYEDVTLEAGIDHHGRDRSALWMDFDGDERTDLLAVTDAATYLYHNLGQGLFARQQLELPGFAMSVAPVGEALALDELSQVGAGPGATAPALGAPPQPVCAGSIDDFVSPGTCLNASTVPTLGMLFPMSTELNVDAATGRVCINTQTPVAQLDVDGDVQVSDQIRSSLTTGTAPFEVASTTRVENLNADSVDGFTATDFRLTANPIDTADLAANAVTSSEILDGSVAAGDLAAGSVSSSHIVNGTIVSDDLATGAVRSVDILDEQIRAEDIGPGQVTASEIATDAVGAAEIAVGAVGSPEIADDAVGPKEIAAGAVRASEIAVDAVGSTHIATGAVGSSEIADSSVLAVDIATGAVAAAEIATGAVRSTEILDGTIANADVSSSADIDGTKIDADFGSQNVTTSRRFGAGTTSPLAPIHSAFGALGVTSAHMTSDDLVIESDNAAFALYSSAGGTNGSHISLKEMDANALVDTWGIGRQTTSGGGRLRVTHGSSQDPMANSTHLSIETNGSIGIGTSNPGDQTKLDVTTGKRYGIFSGTNDTDYNYPYGVIGETTATTGSYGIGVEGASYGQFGTGVSGRSYGTGSLGVGVHGYDDEDGIGVLGETESNSGVSYGVRGEVDSPTAFAIYGAGQFGGTGTKYFIQPHPSDPSKEIRFVCLEGNEAGTYFRGSGRLVDGMFMIEVPEEFRLVSEAEGLTAVVTPVGSPEMLWIESKSLDHIVVRGSADVDFDYVVNGVRRGYAELELVHENRAYRPKERGVPYGSQYPEAHRRLLVTNGILNDDFTPNELTAAMLGWTLRDPVALDDLPRSDAGPLTLEGE